jgi:uncharacterized protein (TIGR00369 family)
MPKQLDLQTLCDESPFHRALGLRIERSVEGVILHTSLGSGFAVNGRGTNAHGGVVASLLDSAATFALIGKTGQDWVTVDLRVDYLRPVRLGELTIQGEVIRAGRSIGRARSGLRDSEGQLCALATGTFLPVRNAG